MLFMLENQKTDYSKGGSRMNNIEYIKKLGEDDWCYCSTKEKKHLRKTHGQTEKGSTSYCQVKGCDCNSWNLKGSPIKGQIKNALPFFAVFITFGLFFTFVILPFLDSVEDPLQEYKQDYKENMLINRLKIMECEQLQQWIIDQKGTWVIYQTEAKDIYEIRC